MADNSGQQTSVGFNSKDVALSGDIASREDISNLNAGASSDEGKEVPPKKATDSSNEFVAKIDVASHEQKSAKRSSGRGSRVVPHTTEFPNVAANFSKEGEVAIDVNGEDKLEISGNESKLLKTGKLLTSVFPINSHCAWVTLPEYDPAKIPKILSHEQVTLPPTSYVEAMKSITGDIRFVSYCALYSRVLPVWVLMSIFVLLIVLFSSSSSGGFPVVILAFVWMFMLLLGILFSVIIRKHLAIALRQSVKDANRLTLPNNLLVGVQDRGQLSCHKVVILFIYYEIEGCQRDIARLLQIHQANSVNLVVSDAISCLIKSSKISLSDNNGRLTDEKANELAYQLLLDYSQQYVKSYMKKQLLFPTRPLEGVSDFRPKHCAKSYCLCQFVEKDFLTAKTNVHGTKNSNKLPFIIL